LAHSEPESEEKKKKKIKVKRMKKKQAVNSLSLRTITPKFSFKYTGGSEVV
jgi:hypothetical protein